MHTRGNRDCHVILRGGKSAPNYGADAVAETLALLHKAALPERVMVDLSHDNSGKDPERQPAVARAVGRQIADGQRRDRRDDARVLHRRGRQNLGGDGELTYGQSITDGCLSWDATVEVLEEFAHAVRERRAAAA